MELLVSFRFRSSHQNVPQTVAFGIGTLAARVYAVLSYVTSLVLLFGAAVLTSTHAREAFIFVFLPGVLLAVLSRFIWTGSRSAMILAFAVSVALELMVVDNARESWGLFLALPVLFGMLAAVGLSAASPRTAAGAQPRVADEVYAAVVYFAGLFAVFMAPFNHSRNFGLPGVALYALLLGLVVGALSVFIWRGRIWAMVAAFALSLAHWIALANINPMLWGSLPNLAAPAVSAVLTAVCIALAVRANLRAKTDPVSSVSASE
jgi:hypothetical protein